MRIAITGGAGYVGSTLIRNLLSDGFEVISLDDQSIGSYKHLETLKFENCRLLIGDIRSPKDLDNAFKSVDAIAHLAAIPGLTRCEEDPEGAISVNVFGTYQVMEAVKRYRIRRLVNCSSAAVYGSPKILPVNEKSDCNPLNLYGVTKLSGEKIIDLYYSNFGIETVNLRFGNVYGVGLYTNWDTVIPKFVRQALGGNPLTIYGDGSNSRDFVHVEDICQALKLSLTKKNIKGHVFNVGNEPTTVLEIAKIVTREIESITEKKVTTSFFSPRPGETKEFSYDLTKIKTMLGYKPQWNLEKGIKELIKYCLSHHQP